LSSEYEYAFRDCGSVKFRLELRKIGSCERNCPREEP
jgi:hypothetical protein